MGITKMIGQRWLPLLVVAGSLAACSSHQQAPMRPEALSKIAPSHNPVRHAALRPVDAATPSKKTARPAADLPKPLLAKIVMPASPLQCVPYARERSNIQILSLIHI